MKTNKHFWSYLPQLFLQWKTFQSQVLEKIKTRGTFINFFFFLQIGRLWDNVEK